MKDEQIARSSKIVAGLDEALSVARGDTPAASITINGHTYYSAAALATARRAGFDACKEQAAEVAEWHDDGTSTPGPLAAWTIAKAIRALEPKT